ncbi:unnamed protein product [Urochloa humidicola]
MQIGGGCNGKESEGGDHKVTLRQKKAKSFKWRSSNSDMNSKVGAGGSDEVYDDTVLCSLSTASFTSLVSRKRVRNLGKVAEQCDAVDPPVPRKLRSAIKKRFVSASSRHVKKRRHLSAISAQISFVDQETRFNGSSLFTEEEEVIADVLLSLSQIPSLSELTADKATVDCSNTNVASTSYSEGATKEGDEIVILPSAADDLASQATCIDKVVGRTNAVNPVAGATDQPSTIDPPPSENEQMQDLSLGTVVNLPSPSKDSSNNSTLKQQKVQFDGSQSHPAQKPEAPVRLVNPNRSDSAPHEREKGKNSSAQEIMPLVQTPLARTPDGYLIKPSSSKLTPHKNTISEASKFTAPGNQDKSYLQPSLVKNVGSSSTKAWKRSITHVYVSHVIQMHMNKEKASQNQVKAEERQHIPSSRSPNGSSAIHKNNPRDEKFYTMHFDVRVPVQRSSAMCDMSAGRQKIVSGNFLNMPTSAALPGTQHLQYLHQQIAQRGGMPYPFPHLPPYSRGNLAPAAALQQMPQQYMSNMGYAPRPGLPASSSPSMMKQLHQLMPTQQQQQQMWQYHVSQYQPRPNATPPPAAACHNNMPSLRPTMGMVPPPAMSAQMELFCAPYQAGGSRQPQQLRLI